MPPQNAVYVRSPHANVTCEECHIGRASFFEQLPRKAQGIKETYDTIFNLYEFPIRAQALAAGARDLREVPSARDFLGRQPADVVHFAEDTENTATTTYLVMKTGGGAKREGLGRGIHWHIVNKVEYFATDELAAGHPVRARRERRRHHDANMWMWKSISTRLDSARRSQEHGLPHVPQPRHPRIRRSGGVGGSGDVA